MNDDAVREIVNRHIRAMLWACQVQRWDVTVKYRKLPDGVSGRCELLQRYRKATINIDPAELDDEADTLNTLRHEILHLVVANYDTLNRLAHRLMRTQDGEAAVEECYHDAEEATVLHLEMMLDHGLGLTPAKLAEKGEILAGRWAPAASGNASEPPKEAEE